MQAAVGGGPEVPATLRRTLLGPAYMFCFPILRAVMRCADTMQPSSVTTWHRCGQHMSSSPAVPLPLPLPLVLIVLPGGSASLRACLLVCSCREPTPLHEAALGVVALHVGPSAK